MNDWNISAYSTIASQCIHHTSFDRAVNCIFQAAAVALPGEVIVVVGPSRVGKSEALKRAMRMIVGEDNHGEFLPWVHVEAENANTDGTFSSKGFSRQLCEAVEHPIYGKPGDDDPTGQKLDLRIHRTPEGMLRNAVERALKLRRTRYVVVDEAHHVAYARGKAGGAAAILDSWKCLAQKAGIVLILVGSYKLLELLCLAPHLLGRQHLVEFPRYRSDEKADRAAFKKVLKIWSEPLRFSENESLLTWGTLLMDGSLGCVGQLALWLRTTLASLEPGATHITRDDLLKRRHAAIHAEMIETEILRGEELIAYRSTAVDDGSKVAIPRQRKSKPFQRLPQRFPLGGRS